MPVHYYRGNSGLFTFIRICLKNIFFSLVYWFIGWTFDFILAPGPVVRSREQDWEIKHKLTTNVSNQQTCRRYELASLLDWTCVWPVLLCILWSDRTTSTLLPLHLLQTDPHYTGSSWPQVDISQDKSCPNTCETLLPDRDDDWLLFMVECI